VLEAVHALLRTREHRPESVFVGKLRPELLRTQPGESGDVFIGVRRESPTIRERLMGDAFQIHIAPSPMSGDSQTSWSIVRSPKADNLWSVLPASAMPRLSAAAIAEPSPLDATESLTASGWGMASSLAAMKVTDPSRFDSLVRALRTIAPDIDDLRFDLTTIDQVSKREMPIGALFTEDLSRKRAYQLSFITRSGARIPAISASEGTLLGLCVLSIIHGLREPTVLLLDNIEFGLHPRAARDFVNQIRIIVEAAERPPQLIVSTHSPYLLDCFKADEIFVVVRNDDGDTCIGKLADHPEFDRWKSEMLPGEFWSMVGEDWLKTRGTPAK
jgi:AAA domain, putative AbiEii toxin, Type IV TA system